MNPQLESDDCGSLARRMIKNLFRLPRAFKQHLRSTNQMRCLLLRGFFIVFFSAEKRKQPDQLLFSHVLWCGNCFIVDPAWCFAVGTLYSCACVFIFFSLSVDYTMALRAAGQDDWKLLVLIWIAHLLLVGISWSECSIWNKINKAKCQTSKTPTSSVWHPDLFPGF